ncbi:hypothetical protein DMUE_3972 [Dictyocoela muelleri]|nr:hypothetical protein DMUE_3972 [Dictyocoela muelleri]
MSNIKNINSITLVDLAKYLRNDVVSKRLLYRVGFFVSPKKCSNCRRSVDMSGCIKNEYIICKKPCYTKIFPRAGTILHKSKLTNRTFLLFLHCYFFDNCSIKTLLTLIDIDRKTVFLFKNKIEKIICRKYDSKKEKLGGDGKVLEIDETLIAKRKYNKGRMVGQVWVFGIVERGSGRCHIEVLKDKTKESFETIIKKYADESSIIMTDEHKSYSGLRSNGFKHYTVKHKENFVDPKDKNIHTQTIESLWNIFKKKKHSEFGIAWNKISIYCKIFSYFKENNITFEEFIREVRI